MQRSGDANKQLVETIVTPVECAAGRPQYAMNTRPTFFDVC